jgi:signal transduction histidine kinase
VERDDVVAEEHVLTPSLLSDAQESSWNEMMWWQKSMRLKVKAESAERASESKSNFLAVMSHEVLIPETY